MAKVIKEQIKKTSSLFLIVSLILNFSIYGLMFNLNIDQINKAKIGLTKETRAAGNASTTVTIKNSPPSMVVSPFEAIISSSTSPVNLGGSITFNLAADSVNDQEANDFWMIICSGGTASVTPGSAPTCISGGVQLCRGAAASSSPTVSSSTSCTYNNVNGVLGTDETRNWTAFVCDNHSNQPGCSNGNDGSSGGDAGSPLYINHAPTVASATTSVNFVNPGQDFHVTATTSDIDAQGGADNTGIAVCSTNGWSTTTNSCLATTYCTSTISSGVSHTCIATTSIPLAHGAYPYYVFAIDQHSFSTSSNQTANYNINDVAPYIGAGGVNLNNGGLITLNAKLAGDKLVYATTTVTDDNGCADMLNTATSTLFESATAGGGNCSPNDNNCYATTSVAGGCSKVAGCSGSIATYVCKFGLKYHAQPTTDGGMNNPYKDDIWVASVRIFDDINSTVATNSPQNVEVDQSAALDVTETFIDYGVLVTGTTTGDYNATTTVNNFGNTPIDSDLDGTSMNRSGGGTISDFNQRFGSSTATYVSLPLSLSSTTLQRVYLGVSRPTSQTATLKWIYWGINVPLGLLSGDYGGKNTFTVRVNSSGAGW